MGKAEGLGLDSLDDGHQDVAVTGTLPMSMTSFVGRDQELSEIRSLFRAGKRLVTLTGIGGIGKTRLALELGFSAGDLGWGCVYFVELAPVTSPDLVYDAALESVGGGSSRSPLQAVVEQLREATGLLVLDCCEHVLDAARRVSEVVLRECPSVAILATSRSPLDLQGELVWPVPSLSMKKRGDADAAGASDAARLFADRASYVQPRFTLSDDAAGAVEAIVRKVDGIPLAIELAAARVRVLSAQVPPQVDQLSHSELKVLRYLPTNLSRPEIAAELSVSVNTVSTHIRSIYAKLGTDDRSAAVRRARELRLLAAPRR